MIPASIGTAVAVLAGVAITTGLANPQPSAAALVLDEVAAVAANSTPLVLHHGEYLYTEVRRLDDNLAATNGGVFYPEYVVTEQTWETAGGVGKLVETNGPIIGFGNGSRAAWIRDGRPDLLPKCHVCVYRALPVPKGVDPNTAVLHVPYDAIPLMTTCLTCRPI